MSRNYKMYFDQKNRRWRKRYHGNQIYFSLKDEETKDSSYPRCWAEFLVRKKEIDAAPPPPTLRGLAALEARSWVYDKAIRDIEEVLANADVFGVEKPALEARLEELQMLRGGFDTGNPPPVLNFVQMNPFYTGSSYATLDKKSQGKTLENLVKDFLEIKRQEVTTKKISAGRWDNLQRHLTNMLTFVGPTSNPANLDASALQRYYSGILADIAENKYGRSYAHERLGVVKQFIRWLWSLEIIENLPRNLTNLQIGCEIKEVKIFPVEEIKTLLAAATGKLKLCLLLMINCGFQQKDIADLNPKEVDWDRGRIKRKRSKTSKEKSTPTIEYLLWPETFELIKEFGLREGERVLHGRTGSPLKWEKVDEKGKFTKNDSIKASYSRLCNEGGIIKPKPLKLLRKTGPSLLQKNPRFSSLYRLLLNRAPHGIDERHYLSYDQKLFDQAIEWLGKEYGVIKSSAPRNAARRKVKNSK